MCKGFAWTAKDTDLRPGTHTFVISKVPVLYSRCAIYFVLILLSVTSIEIFIYFCSFKGLQSFSFPVHVVRFSHCVDSDFCVF